MTYIYIRCSIQLKPYFVQEIHFEYEILEKFEVEQDYASPSSKVSGSFFPRVSGNIKQRPAPIKGTIPKARGGNQELVCDNVATKGAIIEPILATVDDNPTPVFLTTVGNNSPAYK